MNIMTNISSTTTIVLQYSFICSRRNVITETGYVSVCNQESILLI